MGDALAPVTAQSRSVLFSSRRDFFLFVGAKAVADILGRGESLQTASRGVLLELVRHCLEAQVDQALHLLPLSQSVLLAQDLLLLSILAADRQEENADYGQPGHKLIIENFCDRILNNGEALFAPAVEGLQSVMLGNAIML